MGFPADIEGVVKLAPEEPAALETFACRVERALQDARATQVSRTGTLVTMKVAWYDFRLMSFDVLSFVDAGEVQVEVGQPVVLRYRFSCRQNLLISLAAFVVGSIAFAATQPGPVGLLGIVIGSWAALLFIRFSVGYAITASRLPGLFDGVGS